MLYFLVYLFSGKQRTETKGRGDHLETVAVAYRLQSKYTHIHVYIYPLPVYTIGFNVQFVCYFRTNIAQFDSLYLNNVLRCK